MALLPIGATLAVALLATGSLAAQSEPAPVPQQPTPAKQEPAPAPKPPALEPGHLVLVLEGNVGALAVTTAVAKTAPWAGAPKDVADEFAYVAIDADGKELLRVPIDLSKFDTDPTHVGRPDRVEGCEVRSTRIGTLLNVPRVAAAAEHRIVRGKDVIGRTTAAQLAELLRRPR